MPHDDAHQSLSHTRIKGCAHITLSGPAAFVVCWWLQFVVVVRGSGRVGGGRVRISAIVSTVFPAGWRLTWQGLR